MTDKEALLKIQSHHILGERLSDIAYHRITMALERRTEKKPLKRRKFLWLDIGECPQCYNLLLKKHNPCCEQCGQAIDWGE